VVGVGVPTPSGFGLRPHQSLGETIVPADRYRPSPRDFPARIEPPNYPQGTQIRKVDPQNGRISWKGHIFRIGKPFRGKPVAVRPTPQPGTYNVYYRHHHIRTITLPEVSTMSPNTCPP